MIYDHLGYVVMLYIYKVNWHFFGVFSVQKTYLVSFFASGDFLFESELPFEAFYPQTVPSILQKQAILVEFAKVDVDLFEFRAEF